MLAELFVSLKWDRLGIFMILYEGFLKRFLYKFRLIYNGFNFIFNFCLNSCYFYVL